MPEPSATSFPTLFTPEDAERLKQLEQQRKELAKAYQVKFSEQAWGRVPPIEKGIRGAIPTQVLPIVRAVTPGIEPTTEFGFTPEQVAKSGAEMEQEYGELARKQKITRLLPAIQSDLMIAALSGEPIKDLGELMTTFPELKSDFKEEELNYLARVSQALLSASPEQVASGSVFAYEPGQLPLTKEDYDVLKKGRHDPRQVFASVRFARKAEDVAQALRDAFPSTVPEDEALKATRDKLKAYFEQRNRELGITPEGTVPTKQAIQDYHKKVAEEVGTAFPLVDNQGNLVVASKKSDNTVWVDKELVGYAQPDGSVVGFNLRGQPLSTPEIKESTIKDLWDAWYLAFNRVGIGVEKLLTQILPDAFLALSEKTAPILLPFSSERSREISSNEVKVWRERLKARYEQSSLEFQQWLKDHPELEARADWSKPVESPGDFFNPGRIAYLIASNAPIMASALAVATGTTVLTGGNVLAGAAAASAIMVPSMTTDIVDEAVANGAKFEDATSLSTVVGIAMGIVEVAPWMIALRILRPAFMGIFEKNLLKEATGTVIKNLTAKGILGQVAKNTLIITATEELEENIQNIMQNAVIKTFNENRGLLDNALQTTLDTFWAVSPLALMGGAATYRSMKSQLPPQVQQKIDETATKLKDAGLSEEHAEAVALAKVVETETGQAQVQEALEKSVDEAPATSEKVVKLEQEIDSYNKDIERLDQSIKTQLDKLDTLKNPQERQEQQEFIDSFQESLEEVELDKARVLRRLEKARRGVGAKAPVVPEITVPIKGLNLKHITQEIAGDFSIEARMGGKFVGRLNYSVGEGYMTIRLIQVPETVQRQGIASSLLTDAINRATREGNVLLTGALTTEGKDFLTALEEQGIIRLIKPPAEIAVKRPEWFAIEAVTPTAPVAPPAVPEGASTIESVSTKIMNNERLDIAETRYYLDNEDVVEEYLKERLGQVPESAGEFSTTPDKLPLLRSWGDEEEAVRQAVNNSPPIQKRIGVSKEIQLFRNMAKTALNNLQEEYSKATDNKEAIKAVETKLKTMAREAKMGAKTLLGKSWDDLTPTEQSYLTLSIIPNKSLTLPKILEAADIKHFARFLEEMTGLPFYQLYTRLRIDFGSSQRMGEEVLSRLKNDPTFRDIRTNKESLRRITQHINSKNPKLNIPPIEDLTEEEVHLLNTVEDILAHYEPYVRYLRVMNTDSDMESFKKEFPDAVEAGKEVELELAISLKERGDIEGLWSFVKGVKWGTITGYTPWMKSHGSIFPRDIRLGTTRGESRLMRRDSVEFDETLGENLLLDVVRYVKQLESQWRLRPDLETYDVLWDKVKEKFTRSGRIEETLKKWGKELQGMPVEGSLLDDLLNRTWRQAASTIFVHAYMSFRNVHQAVAFHPDRTELVRLFFDKIPPASKAQAQLYYDYFVHQVGGIRADFLITGGSGFPGLSPLNKLSDNLSLYGLSDNIPRLHSFLASYNKAQRATREYLSSNKTDKNLAKWINKSGVVHLTRMEQNYAMQLLAQGEAPINLGVPGLEGVRGADLASLYVAQEITDISNSLYMRAFRAPAEMGSTGRLLYNLLVFPRSYAQRISLQAHKVFSKEATWGEAASGFKDILLLIVVGSLVSNWIKLLTGKPRRAYNAIDVIQWQLGGLAIGVGQDLIELINTTAQAFNVDADQKERDLAKGKIPGLLERNAQVFLPFYRILMDAVESAAGVEQVGIHTAVKELRSLIDKKYTPPDLVEMDRNLWEKIRHVILSSEPAEPDTLKKIQTQLMTDRNRLGEMDSRGNFYTIGDYGNQVESLIKNLPDYLLTEESGFSPLDVFYFESRDKWKEFYLIPTDNEIANKRGFPTRDDWRKSHLEEEAMLLFWDKYGGSVYIQGSKEGEDMLKLRNFWYRQYNIDRRMRKRIADWSLPGQIPLPETRQPFQSKSK